MTATSIDVLRTGIPSQDDNDDRMGQVRDLLVGDHIRTSDARLAALEARVRDIETDLGRQIDSLSVRLEALAGELNGDHRTAFDELARGIGDLGDRMRRISKP